MSKCAPLAFLALFYGVSGLLSVLTRNAMTQHVGQVMTREDLAVIVMAVIGFCIFVVPVLKAISALGDRGAAQAAWSSLLIAGAFVIPQHLLAGYVGDTILSVSDAPVLTIMIGVTATVLFVAAMAMRRPLPLEAPS